MVVQFEVIDVCFSNNIVKNDCFIQSRCVDRCFIIFIFDVSSDLLVMREEEILYTLCDYLYIKLEISIWVEIDYLELLNKKFGILSVKKYFYRFQFCLLINQLVGLLFLGQL